MNFRKITVEDIQPKNVRSETGLSSDVKIRHAWVKQLPEELEQDIKKQFKGVEPETYFSFCQEVDKDVSDRWIEMMKKNVEQNKSTMVKSESGLYRLSDELCNKTDELLLLAAQEVILSMY